MRRDDLLVLCDEDLIGASSKLTLKRARRELEKLEVRFEEREDALVAEWSDGVTCELPAEGGLAASRCTCPARKLCVHRVRTLLAYRAHAARAPATGPESVDDDWSPASFDDDALRAAGSFDAAVRMLHDGLEVARESRTAVTFPELGVRVRFAPGRGLDAATCSCRAPGTCLHRVIGALSYREVLPPLADDPLVGARLDRVWQVASMLASVGLDGLPPEAIETLETTRLEIIGDRLHGAAGDLGTLAELLDAYHRRSTRFDGRAWLASLARLALRADALPRARGADRRLLLGEGRRARLRGKKLSVVGLGAEGFAGPRGAVVRLWLAQRDTGRVISCTVGRGGDASLGFLYRSAPVWEEHPVQALVGASFVLHAPRSSPDGSLGGGGETRVRRIDPAPPRDVVAPQLVVRSPSELADRWRARHPPLLRPPEDRDLLALLALDPRHVPSPRFDEVAQRLRLDLRLVDGGGVRVSVVHRDDTARLVSTLEAWPWFETLPDHALARVTFGPGGFVARPIALFAEGRGYQVQLDAGPPIAMTPRVQSAPDGPPPQRPRPPSAADAVLEGLLQSLEGWVVSGLDRPADWRRERLRQHAHELAALGLTAGAARVHALLEAPGPDARLRALVGTVFFATSLAEAVRAERAAG